MPRSLPTPCSNNVCKNICHDLYCDECRPKQRKNLDRNRGTAHQRGYTSRWARYAKQYRIQNPLCVRCSSENELGPADVVDHIIPHNGDQELFWDPKNHQSLCKPHHDVKTASEDGGFGNEIKYIGGGGLNL